MSFQAQKERATRCERSDAGWDEDGTVMDLDLHPHTAQLMIEEIGEDEPQQPPPLVIVRGSPATPPTLSLSPGSLLEGLQVSLLQPAGLPGIGVPARPAKASFSRGSALLVIFAATITAASFYLPLFARCAGTIASLATQLMIDISTAP